MIEINGHKIGKGFPTYIVAELSPPYNPSYAYYDKAIRIARECGADAVKLRTYKPDKLTLESSRPEFKIKGGTLWDGKTLYELYKSTYVPWGWQRRLKKLADDVGIDIFSTVFDQESVDFCDEIGMCAFKISSFELVDYPLVEYVASKGKPVIISTGMASIEEVSSVVAHTMIKNEQLALLKCVSAYPAEPKDMNLNTIPHMAKCFGVDVGLSDHSVDPFASFIAVSLGACIVEKHLMLEHHENFPDANFSITPYDFKNMVLSIRATERLMGKVFYGVHKHEKSSLVFRRSLFAIKYIRKGEKLTEQNIRSIRPANGLTPDYYRWILGAKARKPINKGEPLALEKIKEL